MDKDKGFFVVVTNKKSLIEVCYRKTVLPIGLWRAQDPPVSSLPILAMQLISIMSITRILLITLKPLRQPHIVAEILVGWRAIGSNSFGRTSCFLLQCIAFS